MISKFQNSTFFLYKCQKKTSLKNNNTMETMFDEFKRDLYVYGPKVYFQN